MARGGWWKIRRGLEGLGGRPLGPAVVEVWLVAEVGVAGFEVGIVANVEAGPGRVVVDNGTRVAFVHIAAGWEVRLAACCIVIAGMTGHIVVVCKGPREALWD